MNTKLLKTVSILYVEDHEETQDRIYSILKNLFKNIYLASSGDEGVELFNKYSNDIDLIVSDINMPNLTGIEMLNKIRETKSKTPIIYTTAYSDSNYLLEAIKLNAAGYMLKPFDIKDLVFKIEQVLEDANNAKLVKLQELELKQYIDVIDKVAIISKTDNKGKILFVNDRFCETSGYEREELIGKAHNIIRHPDMSSMIFENLWQDLKEGKSWQGKIKNRKKDGEAYFVNSTIIPQFNTKGEVKQYIGIRFLITQEENEKRQFKKNILNSIKEAKEKELQYSSDIKNLEASICKLEQIVTFRNEAFKVEKDKNQKQYSQIVHYEQQIKKLTCEMQEAKKDDYKKIASLYEKLKLLKELSDNQKLENDRLIEEMEARKEEYIKLNEQVAEQSKLIIDLRDVIEHRESQLEKLKY